MKKKLTLFIQLIFTGLLFFSVVDVGYSQNSISLTGGASVWGDCGSTDAGTAGTTIVSFEIASSSLLPPTGGPPFVITAPTGYELKKTASSTYTDFIQLTVVGGTITGLPLGIDIRLKSTNTAGTAPAGYITFNYAGDITINHTAYVWGAINPGTPEIDVLGNSNQIANGLTTLSTVNGTDFGSVAVVDGNQINKFEIFNLGSGNLTLSGAPKVSLTNTTDFAIYLDPVSPVGASSSTSVRIIFDPVTAGTKTCTVSIANDDGDENPYTFDIGGNGIGVPDNVVAATASGVTTTSFTAVWGPVAGADSYLLDVSDDNFSTYIGLYQDYEITGTSQLISGLTGGKNYYYRVKAKNAAGNSASESNVIILATMETVTATSATLLNTTDFTANWNLASGASSYSIEWDDNIGFLSPSIASSGTNSYLVNTGLVAGSSFYYRVKAVNTIPDPDVLGEWSSTITVLTVADSPSAGFDNGAISANSFDPTWNAPVGQTVSEYKIDVATDVAFTTKIVDNLTHTSGATISGLSELIEYHWRVRSVNASGTSVESDTQTFTTSSNGNGEISVSGNGVTIIDGDNSPTTLDDTDFGDVDYTNGSKFAIFEIYNSGTGALSLTSNPRVSLSNTTDFLLEADAPVGVAASDRSTFRILFDPTSVGSKTCEVTIANDDTDENPYNFIIQGTGIGIPDDVVAVNASSVTSSGFTAVWSPVAGSNITYLLDVSTDINFGSYIPVYMNYSLSETSQPITSLTEGTTYYYRVRADNAAGNSANESNVITVSTIETVTATSATSVGTSSFTANWNEAVGSSTYSIQWDDNISFTSPSSVNLSLTSYLINTGLTAGNTFYYRVRGVSGDAYGDWSNTISQITVPDAPSTGFASGSVTSSSFVPMWTAPTGQTISEYRLDVAIDNSFLNKVVNDQIHTSGSSVSSLSANTTYYWRVRSVNSAGTSINSVIQTVTTTGSTSSSWKTNATTVIWDNVDNWTAGIPTSATDAIILAGSNQPEISGTATCSNLTINEGANVKIIASGSLTISNTLTLESSSASTDAGAIIDLGSLSYTTLNAKRYITANLAHLLSSPVASNTLTGAITGVTSGNGFAHQYNPETGAWDGLTAPGNLAVMKGYRVKFTDAAHTATFTGTLNTGNKTIAISRSANNFGWNLVGNPYPSVIDWDMVSKPANMNGTLAKWNDATSNYIYYNEGGSASRFVSPMNGFFVQVALGQLSETFQLDNDVRTKSSGTFYKRGGTQKWLNISVRGENGYSDKAFIRVLNNSTINGDGRYNAYKLFSPVDEVPQLYSTDFGSDPMAINSIGEIKDNLVVPFGLRIGEAGKYTISVEGINDFEEKNIYLEDVVENKMIPIKIGGSELPANLYYSFTSDVSQINERFKVHFSNVITDVEDIEASVPHIYSQQNNIYINTTNVMNDVIIRVFDVVGKQVGLINKKELNGLSKYKMNVPDGIYIIKVNSTEGVNTQKVYLTK